MPPYRPARKCKATNIKGEPCGRHALHGAFVCYTHGGAGKKTKAAAEVREKVMRWGLHDETADPGETLLKLVTQSAERAHRYAAELERMCTEQPDLEKALIGDVRGEFGKQGEYVRGMAVLEAAERDRCANFCRLAIAAGLAERQVRLAERQGQMIADVLRAVLADPSLGLTATQIANVPTLIRKHLQAITAG